MPPIRLGLIGCGNMSQAHMGRFHVLSDRVTIAAAADTVAERAQDAAALFPGARPSTDYRTILDEVDAVLIALPHHLHHSVALECLAAGKHVLLEKPMALNERECLDLIAAEEAAGRVLMVAYCMRYHPLVSRMKELLDQRTYGDVFQVSIWTEQYTYCPPDHWSASAATLGGGQLFSHGCHYIDILLWYLGQPVCGMHYGTNLGTTWMDWEGTSNVVIAFEGGRLGYHFGTWGAHGTRLGYSFHAHCTGGMLEADITHGRLIAHTGGDRVETLSSGRVPRLTSIGGGAEQVLLEAPSGKHLENELAHFLDCIETGRRPLTDGPGSLQGLRVIWRLYEAEENHAEADLRGLGLDQIDLAPQERRWTGVG